MTNRPIVDLPRWVLALGPVVILLLAFGLLAVAFPADLFVATDETSTLEMLVLLTIIGAIAGIIPVAIGMCWFPFIRTLDPRYLHAFLALAAGVLVFIAIEMTEDIVDNAVASDNLTLAAILAVAGVVGTFAVMYAATAWRHRTMATSEKSGLEIAYLVALALGLHSIGEGLGIGVSFVQGETAQVLLLVLAFILHNVMEGPTVVAAVARDRTTPPLRHFAAMGTIAGGPVILGGWIGSFGASPLLAVLFFAIAVGAIVQVLIEVAELVRIDAGTLLTRLNVTTFVGGVLLMFLLEDVLTDVLLEGGMIPV